MDSGVKFNENVSKLICVILNNTIGKLRVIQAVQLDDKDCVDESPPVCQRVIDLDWFQACKDVQGALNAEKFQLDLEKLIGILQKLSDELLASCTFSSLIEAVDKMSSELLTMHSTLTSHGNQKLAVKKLEEMLSTQKSEEKKMELAVDNKLFGTLTRKEQLKNDSKVDLKYNKDWIASKIRQNDMKLTNDGLEVKLKLFNATRETFDAEDVHFKVVKFYRRRIEEIKRETKLMNETYDQQMEQIDLKLSIANSEKNELEQQMKAERENFDRREAEMKSYLDEKQRKKEAEKLLALQSKQIVVIQAWWRGQMVRKFFGGFKKYKKRAKEIRKEFRAMRAARKKRNKKKK